MAELDVEPAEYIWFDMFPALVRGPETDLRDCRVILTDNHLYAFSESPTGPVVSLKQPHTDGYTLTMMNNQVGEYTITRQLTCGCGATLRGIYPFLGVPFRTPSM